MPSTPVSGVRISWLIAARNSDFARLACSAAASAACATRNRLLTPRTARNSRTTRITALATMPRKHHSTSQ